VFSLSVVTFPTTRLYNQIKSSPKSFLCVHATIVDPKTEGSVILEMSMYKSSAFKIIMLFCPHATVPSFFLSFFFVCLFLSFSPFLLSHVGVEGSLGIKTCGFIKEYSFSNRLVID